MADLKLKDLRYLVAVADTRHFGHAAARCFVSQPTLSAQLKKLEEYLGVQLIERHPRRVALTEAGAQVVSRARRIIEASDEIVTLAELRRDPLAGRLRIALLPTIGPYLLPLVATRIRKKLPRLDLLLYEYQTGPMLEQLQSGHIDLGILALPVPAEGLVQRDLFAEPFVVAVPDHHALADRKSVKTSDLDGQTVLLLEDGHCLRDQALDVCSHTRIHEKQDFRATSLETLRQMVASGAGITLLPELASHGAYGNARGVRVIPFSRPAPARRIGALWRKTTARTAAIEAVCSVIAEIAPRHLGGA
jgi:LysR family transcriptional regulator, hydrogen peroxide-inducible genes activator